MFTFPFSRRPGDRQTTRRTQGRRPQLETFEGRQLLSGIVGNHIGAMAVPIRHAPAVPAIVGNHIGTGVAAIVGNHIGTNVAAIHGNHIGTSVAAIQGAHIGTGVAAIQGAHIGFSFADA